MSPAELESESLSSPAELESESPSKTHPEIRGAVSKAKAKPIAGAAKAKPIVLPPQAASVKVLRPRVWKG